MLRGAETNDVCRGSQRFDSFLAKRRCCDGHRPDEMLAALPPYSSMFDWFSHYDRSYYCRC